MKFNGMEVKVSRKFYGHEGETCYQGSIYCDGKKVGTWSVHKTPRQAVEIED